MGEVRFVWPDMTSPKGQIQFSSLVTALVLREMVAVVRWVLKDQAEPVIGICIPEQDFPDAGKRLDFLFWIKVSLYVRGKLMVQLPFAEDEHNFWFPSLSNYKTASGKMVKEHPLLPTDEQCELMDSFVEAMDLDKYAESGKPTRDEGADEDEDME
jgi:ATP-dependent DNA helicase 2 subunit 2